MNRAVKTSKKQPFASTPLFVVFGAAMAAACSASDQGMQEQTMSSSDELGIGGTNLLEAIKATWAEANGGPAPQSPLRTALDKAQSAQDHIEKALELKKKYEQCVAEGKDKEGCAARELDWRGVCYMADSFLNNNIGYLGTIGIPWENLCNGDPTLKCCKYTPDQNGCHSAFNTEKPINCEGNDLYGGTAASFGDCISTGSVGCLCNYIPECVTESGGGVSLPTDPIAQARRLNHFVADLGTSFYSVFEADPDAMLSYAAFQGCRAHRDVLLNWAPFAKPLTIPPQFTPGSNYATSSSPDVEYIKGLMALAVRRVITGIPNFMERQQYILSRTWSASEKLAYLGAINADTVLRAQLGDVGFELLKTAEPNLYQLFAVPMPGEAATPPSPNDVGGCTLGAPVSLAVSPSVNGSTASLTLSMSDSVAADNPEGVYLVRILWGDGTVSGHVFVASDPTTHSVMHTYESTGIFSPTAMMQNTTGLNAVASTSITIAEVTGGPATLPPATESVDIEMTAVVKGYEHGTAWVDVIGVDLDGKEHPLGRKWTALDGAAYSTVQVNLTQPSHANETLATLTKIILVPYHVGGTQIATSTLMLGSTTLVPPNNYLPRVFSSTLRTVKVFPTGAAYPVSPTIDPTTNKLAVPLSGARIEIDLVDDSIAYAGCRPTYDGSTPTMITANGGCHDVSTGLTWSFIAPTKMSWHQAVWGSELAGNAQPDSFDGGRTNDYAGGTTPATPDASTQNHCKALSQGGQQNWRLPTDAELAAINGPARAGTYFPFNVDQAFASSTTWSSTYNTARTLSLASSNKTYPSKTTAQAVICVRSN